MRARFRPPRVPGESTLEYLRSPPKPEPPGTLSAVILTRRRSGAHRAHVRDAIAGLRYDLVNIWCGVGSFLLASSWGDPRHTLDDVQSGIGSFQITTRPKSPQKRRDLRAVLPLPRSLLQRAS